MFGGAGFLPLRVFFERVETANQLWWFSRRSGFFFPFEAAFCNNTLGRSPLMSERRTELEPEGDLKLGQGGHSMRPIYSGQFIPTFPAEQGILPKMSLNQVKDVFNKLPRYMFGEPNKKQIYGDIFRVICPPKNSAVFGSANLMTQVGGYSNISYSSTRKLEKMKPL